MRFESHAIRNRMSCDSKSPAAQLPGDGGSEARASGTPAKTCLTRTSDDGDPPLGPGVQVRAGTSMPGRIGICHRHGDGDPGGRPMRPRLVDS